MCDCYCYYLRENVKFNIWLGIRKRAFLVELRKSQTSYTIHASTHARLPSLIVAALSEHKNTYPYTHTNNEIYENETKSSQQYLRIFTGPT